MFNQAVPHDGGAPHPPTSSSYSLSTLVKYYGCDEAHVEHDGASLSIQLFKQLRVLHKFPRVYLKVLKIAASLHDSGERRALLQQPAAQPLRHPQFGHPRRDPPRDRARRLRGGLPHQGRPRFFRLGAL